MDNKWSITCSYETNNNYPDFVFSCDYNEITKEASNIELEEIFLLYEDELLERRRIQKIPDDSIKNYCPIAKDFIDGLLEDPDDYLDYLEDNKLVDCSAFLDLLSKNTFITRLVSDCFENIDVEQVQYWRKNQNNEKYCYCNKQFLYDKKKWCLAISLVTNCCHPMFLFELNKDKDKPHILKLISIELYDM